MSCCDAATTPRTLIKDLRAECNLKQDVREICAEVIVSLESNTTKVLEVRDGIHGC
jgi:hypothetical protein